MEVAGSNDGEQRPDGGDEEGEGEGADEGGLKVGCVADVAESGADGGGDALGGEGGFEERDALPVDEDPDDSGEGEGIEEEDVGGASVGALEGGKHESTERGT